MDLLAVDLYAGGLANQVEHDPDAGVASHFLHFDANLELEAALRAKGEHKQVDMVHNILPSGVEFIFVHQAEQLGLGDVVLCAEHVVENEPFAVLLVDDFLTQQSASSTSSVTKDLRHAFETSEQTQLSVMQVASSNISKYAVIVKRRCPRGSYGYC